MSIHPAPLTNLPWTQGPHPLEKKKVCAGGHLVQLRFEPGFEDPDWCTHGHTLLVQDGGALHVQLEELTVEVQPGNALVLTAGTAHKVSNRGDQPVTLLAIQHGITPAP